jgi:RNA polymerase sigma-70 factor (ECF subfamily)
MTLPPPANACLSALAAGRPEAYAALYDRLGAALLRVAQSMLRDRGEAEDAVQDVFVDLVRARDRLPQVRNLDAYMFVSLRHEVGRRLARRQTERKNMQRLALATVDPIRPLDEKDPALERALASLPVEQREVISLKIDGELTFAQIADVLGISLNTAASRYRYALEKLRRELEQEL